MLVFLTPSGVCFDPQAPGASRPARLAAPYRASRSRALAAATRAFGVGQLPRA